MNNFSIFKNDNKKSEKEPDYRITSKIGEEFSGIGACWRKKSASGIDYLSCKLQTPYGGRAGYVIEEMGDSSTLTPQAPQTASQPLTEADTKLSDGSDLSKIPF